MLEVHQRDGSVGQRFISGFRGGKTRVSVRQKREGEGQRGSEGRDASREKNQWGREMP